MPLRTKSKVDRRVTNATGFDRAVVRSVLVLHNELFSDTQAPPSPDDPRSPFTLAFGWLPAVMRARAQRERLDPNKFQWEKTPIENLATVMGILQFMIGAFRLKLGTLIRLPDGRQVSREKSYQETVEGL